MEAEGREWKKEERRGEIGAEGGEGRRDRSRRRRGEMKRDRHGKKQMEKQLYLCGNTHETGETAIMKACVTEISSVL